MNREGLIILSTAIALLTGCAAQVAEREDRACSGYGASTPAYSACRQFLAAERQQRGAAMMAVGAGLMQPSQPRSDLTVYNIGNRTYHCVRSGNMVNCN